MRREYEKERDDEELENEGDSELQEDDDFLEQNEDEIPDEFDYEDEDTEEPEETVEPPNNEEPEEQEQSLKNANLTAKTKAKLFKNPQILIAGFGILLLFIIFLGVFYSATSGVKFIASKCKTVSVTIGAGDESYSDSMPLEQYLISSVYSATKDIDEPEDSLYQALYIIFNTKLQASGGCSVSFVPEVTDVYYFSHLTEASSDYINILSSVKNSKYFVMTNKESGEVYPVDIDGFCYTKSDEDFFTLSQNSLRIPKDWTDKNVKSDYFRNCPCNDPNSALDFESCYRDEWNYPDDEEPDRIYVDGGTGTGFSIYGAYYLASAGTSYNGLLKEFYPDGDWELLSTDEKLNKTPSTGNGLNGFDYISPKCSKITTTTITSETGGQGSGPSITLSLDEYIEGVVYHEFRGANNLEAYKALAVASRSYALAIVDSKCVMNNSTAEQTFTAAEDRTDANVAAMIRQAVEETRGVVITINNQVQRTEYDAFCYTTKDEDYYTLSQGQNGGQIIPTSWVEKHISSKTYKNCPCNNSSGASGVCFNDSGKYSDGGHGRGMSQYGSLYLASESKWGYQKILKYFYGDDVVFKSIFRTNFSTDGSNSNTNNTTELNIPLKQLLEENGSSIVEFNQLILSNVVKTGVSTRGAVVAAAVTLIDTLASNYQKRIPYTYGGNHAFDIRNKDKKYINKYINSFHGVDPDWGTPIIPNKYGQTTTYYHYGPDCSSFISWSLRNAGFIIKESVSGDFTSVAGGETKRHPVSGDFAGQPGDLMWHSGHIMLIIYVDHEKSLYRVAQSGSGQTGMNVISISFNDPNEYVVDMSDYYSNPANVNANFVENYRNEAL